LGAVTTLGCASSTSGESSWEASTLESTSLVSLEEIDKLLKDLNERLRYLEKVVLPSRVTEEELHAGIGDPKLDRLAMVGSLRVEMSLLKQQMATKNELENVRQELSQQLARPEAAVPRRITKKRT
jgi:hypothetical protein